MRVLITSPKGKEKLVEAFKEVSDVTEILDSSVKVIVPTVDEELPFLSLAREWFNKQGILVTVASCETITTCRDKAEFSRFCKRHGFGIPETAQFEAIVKPRFGKGSKGIFVVDRSMISQEIVTWPEYSIDYYHDEFTTSIIPRRRLNIVNGASQEAQFDNDPILINEARRLGAELKLEYHNVMQCFFDGKNIKWIEVNARYGGGSWLTFDNFNSPQHIVETLEEKVSQ